MVVTGGTSALDGLPELAEEIFELPTRRGTPQGIGGLLDRVQGPEYATGVGLAIWGSERPGKHRFRVYDGSTFRKVRQRMREWFLRRDELTVTKACRTAGTPGGGGDR